MPHIHPKPIETLQAQAATFAAEVGGVEDGHQLAHRMGQAASGEFTQLDINPSQRIQSLSEQERDYIKFLRGAGGAGHESVGEREDLLRNYEEFAPVVDPLVASLEGMKADDRRQRPDFLGGGSSCGAFAIGYQGKQYAVRVPWSDVNRSMDREYVQTGIRTKGIPHLEQLTAVSYERGVTIAELMPGRSMGSMTAEDLNAISDEQLEEFVGTLKHAHDIGLWIDPKPSNIFYDRKEGFGLIDLSDKKITSTDGEIGIEVVMDFGAAAIGNAGVFNFVPKTEEDYLRIRDLFRASIPVLERYKQVCARQFGGEEGGRIEAALADRIGFFRDWQSGYENPDWIRKQLSYHKHMSQGRKRLRDEGRTGWETAQV